MILHTKPAGLSFVFNKESLDLDNMLCLCEKGMEGFKVILVTVDNILRIAWGFAIISEITNFSRLKHQDYFILYQDAFIFFEQIPELNCIVTR